MVLHASSSSALCFLSRLHCPQLPLLSLRPSPPPCVVFAVKIMVRTKDLGRALSKVIGRALRRKSTASARRQWEVAPVVEDVQHVDHAIDEVHEQPQEVAADDEVVDAGAHDTLVLTAYDDRERDVFKLSSHGRKIQKFDRPVVEIEGLVAATRLSPLIARSLDTGDRRLISAFAEMWDKETSCFHLPVGEVTIALNDVAFLLHLPITGVFHNFETLHVDEVVLLLIKLLEMKQTLRRYNFMGHIKCDVTHWNVAARAYMLHLLGYTLFANKSATHMHVVFFDAFRDLTQSGSYPWGAVVLVYMYDNLNDAFRSSAKQIAGYITLLQCWIYEHFPFVADTIAIEDYHERKPLSTYRKHLDILTSNGVCWMSYGNHRAVSEFEPISLFSGHIPWGPVVVIHRSERVVQQFGYVQNIPPHTSTWIHFSKYLASVGRICVVPGQCAADYIDRDPARHPPVVQDDTYVKPDIPQYLVAAAAMKEGPTDARSHVEQLQHTVDACQAIAERLERLLNLRIVTEGTEIYRVMEDCLRIARGVTTERNVYVWSRRRRRMEDA
ncbi:Protein MAIN-LIKE 2 [Glycine soja]